MKQADSWHLHYQEVLNLVKKHHRMPSKHNEADRQMMNWLKYNKRLLRSGRMPVERQGLFQQLLTLGGSYRKINQYAYLNPQQNLFFEKKAEVAPSSDDGAQSS